MTPLVLGLLALLGALIWHKGGQPYVHRVMLKALEPMIDVLLRRGFAGGTLTISAPGAPAPFLQLRKVMPPETRQVQLEFGFPHLPWSDAVFTVLVERFEEAGIPYAVTHPSPPATVEAFITVNCAQDVEFAARVLRLAGAGVGWSEEQALELRFMNISARDETIGRIAKRAA